MDPDECLKQIRELVQKLAVEYRQNAGTYAIELAEKVDALDQWLKNGGFPPADWW